MAKPDAKLGLDDAAPADSAPEPVEARATRAASPAPIGNARRKGWIVDEEIEVTIAQGIGFVTFRPGQRVDDPYLLNLARENDIALREK